jgi:hypothetical protein
MNPIDELQNMIIDATAASTENEYLDIICDIRSFLTTLNDDDRADAFDELRDSRLAIEF